VGADYRPAACASGARRDGSAAAPIRNDEPVGML